MPFGIIPDSAFGFAGIPNRAMNDLNSYSALRFEFRSEECDSWKAFAKGVTEGYSWNSEWFSVARRFFLYGGGKEFNPKWDDVDRIVDYMTAVEAAVVPEMDFARRRISQRSAKLISTDPPEQSVIVALMKQLYDIRSSVVHGSKLSDEKRDWLTENCVQVECRIRQVLVAAVQKVPAVEAERKKMLANLYDPSDNDRADFTIQKFRGIKDTEVRKTTASEIARLAELISSLSEGRQRTAEG
jgi:hypothetical protein